MSKQLDFTALDKLAYKDFDTEEKREERDSLLQAGFTFVETEDNPFTAPPPVSAPPPPQDALTDHTGGRNYKKLYRIAHDYHKSHNPPTVERDYWKDHTPGLDEPPPSELEYWKKAAEDMGAAAAQGGGDPFLTGLLIEIMNELEREYKTIREEASGGA